MAARKARVGRTRIIRNPNYPIQIRKTGRMAGSSATLRGKRK